jgi:hypothetical protein
MGLLESLVETYKTASRIFREKNCKSVSIFRIFTCFFLLGSLRNPSNNTQKEERKKERERERERE